MNTNISSSSKKYFSWDYDIALIRLAKVIQLPSAAVKLPSKELSVSDIQDIKCWSAGKSARFSAGL